MTTSDEGVEAPRAGLTLGDPTAVAYAAERLAAGDTIAHGFGNFYAITARPEREVVEGINAMKGRPRGQVGSVLTTPVRAARLFDWAKLPDGLTAARVFDLMDRLFALGPFGFRGPAAAHVPDHLTSFDGEGRTTQLIAPGSRCPSNAFLARAMERSGTEFLYVTSANRSRHQTGADDEPAHFRAAAIAQEFAGAPRFHVLAHEDDEAARRAHPLHAPMSTTILAFHRLEGATAGGRPRLCVERHGSLPLDALAPIVEALGFALALGPKAGRRLALRRYDGADG
jgi:tRNA A37 threonylcarbamoyladenosine synthetase subunit TsaC/SUA5/YrdC